MLSTDGVIENRGEHIDAGLERLRAAAERTLHDHVDQAIERILRDVGPATSPTDDVAIVIVDRLESPKPVHR